MRRSCVVTFVASRRTLLFESLSAVYVTLYYIAQITYSHQPQISRDYLLNLSISIGKGKETNKDSQSNGE